MVSNLAPVPVEVLVLVGVAFVVVVLTTETTVFVIKRPSSSGVLDRVVVRGGPVPGAFLLLLAELVLLVL